MTLLSRLYWYMPSWQAVLWMKAIRIPEERQGAFYREFRQARTTQLLDLWEQVQLRDRILANLKVETYTPWPK